MANTWTLIKQQIHTIFCDRKNDIVDMIDIDRYNGGDMTECFMKYVRREKLEKREILEALHTSENRFIEFIVDEDFFDWYQEKGQPASYGSLGL